MVGRLMAKELKKAPGLLGYRMPAEWKAHAGTWMAFPHHRTDWPGKLSNLPHTFAEMARVIAGGERVRMLVETPAERQRGMKIFERAGVPMDQVDWVLQETNRSWLRDSMPLWVTRKSGGKSSEKVAVNFRFDGWARYRDHKKDDAAGRFVASRYAKQSYSPRGSGEERLVLEGGSIDVDEHGTLLTTEECLLTSPRARFRGWSRESTEDVLKSCLGVKKVLWLPTGIVGDDTSGHVDDFARFAPGGRVLICDESRKTDDNYLPLKAAQRALVGATNARGKKLELVKLPMPDPVFYDGDRLPASYANFYVANSAVLVPVFNDRHDQAALELIGRCFPDRPAIGVYARDLVVGLGTFHCSTMQEPA